MTYAIHRHCIKTAAGVSPRLKAALIQVGRLKPLARRGRSLPQFLARAVVGQQLSTAAARTIWARIEAAVREHRSAIPDFFTEQHKPILRRCGVSNAKAQALIAIRAAQAAGVLATRRLRAMDHARRSQHLCAIWGIGQWTADMTSIFYFRDPDIWPQGDGGVYRAMCRLTGRRSKAALAKLATGFAPYRSFLALYMWRTLDSPRLRARRAAAKTKLPL